MKLEASTSYAETKKQTKESAFEIADTQLLISMYRDTIYKNKIRVIPQEYMCNARDAHREMHIDNVPIEVTLPSMLDPVLKIRDFGPGISDGRMSIFTKYGASTKRNSNNETGGFGIGCKCAWSYTEQFTLDTIYDDGGERHRKIYSIYIKDHSDPGSIRLVSERIIDEDKYDENPTGSVIKIPVMDSDIDNFISSVRAVGSHWDVKPTIIGNDEYGEKFEWPTFEYSEEKDNWKLCQTNHKLYAISSNSYAIIDGIGYNIDISLLEQGKSEYQEVDDNVKEVKCSIDADTARFFRQTRMVFFFNTGDLKISPNREDFDYNFSNVKKLCDILTQAKSEVVDIFRKKVLYDPNMTLIQIMKEASKFELFSVKVLWTNPQTNKEVDITSLMNHATNKSCFLYKDGDYDSVGGIPFDDIDDDTAIYYYRTETTAENACRRLVDHPEILEEIEAKKVVILYARFRYNYDYDDYTAIYQNLMNRKMGTIKKPKASLKKMMGKNSGIFKTNKDKLIDCDQILIEEVDDLDFSKALFIKRKGRNHYIFYGTDKQREFTNAYFEIHENVEIYVVNKNGENCLKKAGIKINWIEDRVITKKLHKYLNQKSVRLKNFSNDYSINNLMPVKGHIYWYLRDNKEAFNAWDTYIKAKNTSNSINNNVHSKYIELARIYDVKYVVENFQSVVEMIRKNVPFIGLIDNCSGSNKNKLINIIRSYKEYDNGQKDQ